MPKVSIIIPVYNMEKYLSECLDSVINQTLKDIEIICIDDCSTDNSLNILQEYAAKDDRIIVLKQEENQGQGVARNRGIDAAHGEYIGFTDPDDWIDHDMYEQMYNQAINLSSEIVICNYQRYLDGENKYQDRHFLEKAVSEFKAVKIYPNVGENIDKNIIEETLLISPCYCVNRIYSKELLTKYNIKFPDQRCFEDIPFILNTHLYAKYISYIHKPFYKYRIHKNSTLRKSDKKYSYIIQTYDNILAFFKEKGLYEKFKLNIDYFIVVNTFWGYKTLNNEQYKKTLLKNAKKYMSNSNYKLLREKLGLSFRKKIFHIKKTKTHNIITIFGIKIKHRRKKKGKNA